MQFETFITYGAASQNKHRKKFIHLCHREEDLDFLLIGIFL